MNKRTRYGAILIALLAVGCGVAPNAGLMTAPIVDVFEGIDPHAVPMSVLAVGDEFPAPLESITPSSTRSDFFPVLHVRDNRLTSAWGPAAGDAAPRLTFHLSQSVTVSAIGIKLSLGRFSSTGNQRVLVDVEVSNDGGATWDTVATGLNPPETAFTSFSYPPVQADTVRLSFRATGGNDIRDLLVCEANVIDPLTSTYSPTPTYTPTPTPTPTYTPTSTPAPTPTPTSTPGCSTFVTFSNGGWGQALGNASTPAVWRDTNWGLLESAFGDPNTLEVPGTAYNFPTVESLITFLNGASGLERQVVVGYLNYLKSTVDGTGGLTNVTILTGPFAGETIGSFGLQALALMINGDTSVLTATRTAAAFQTQAQDITMFFHAPGAAPDGRAYGCPSL